MPRTRSELEREAKVEEILAAAQRRLRDGGWEALSVAGVARELGLAQNAVYWYFPSKDHLFVAALERTLRDLVARKPRGGSATPIDRVLWFTDQFADLAPLWGSMHDRARSSEVVAQFVRELEAIRSRMLGNVLRGHVPDDELPVAVETFRTTIEGAYAAGLDRAARHRVLRFSLERLLRG